MRRPYSIFLEARDESNSAAADAERLRQPLILKVATILCEAVATNRQTIEKDANSGANIQTAGLRSEIERDRPIRNIFVNGN
jgi:hypothetical protein